MIISKVIKEIFLLIYLSNNFEKLKVFIKKNNITLIQLISSVNWKKLWKNASKYKNNGFKKWRWLVLNYIMIKSNDFHLNQQHPPYLAYGF